MSPTPFAEYPWVLVDIGNQRCKLAILEHGDTAPLPVDPPFHVGAAPREFSPRLIPPRIMDETQTLCWWIGSVHQATQQGLVSWIERNRPDDQIHRLAFSDFPLEVRVRYPEKVGVDRLAAAVAAATRLSVGESAVVVDAGTAITVDLVTGAHPRPIFHGGVIACGPKLASIVLEAETDALPLVPVPRFPQPPLGEDTISAIASGLYWGLVGTVKELVAQLHQRHGSVSRVVLTGGESDLLSDQLDVPTAHEPHLVLQGLQISARYVSGSDGEDCEGAGGAPARASQ